MRLTENKDVINGCLKDECCVVCHIDDDGAINFLDFYDTVVVTVAFTLNAEKKDGCEKVVYCVHTHKNAMSRHIAKASEYYDTYLNFKDSTDETGKNISINAYTNAQQRMDAYLSVSGSESLNNKCILFIGTVRIISKEFFKTHTIDEIINIRL